MLKRVRRLRAVQMLGPAPATAAPPAAEGDVATGVSGCDGSGARAPAKEPGG